MSDAAAGVDDGSAARRASAPGSDPLARVVFALLVLACFAAFFLTQRLKHTPTAVQDFKLTPFFSPYPGGHVKQEAISFKLANAEAVTVTIIDADGNTVATLVRDQPVRPLQTVLAALERPPRHRAPLQPRRQRREAARSCSPANDGAIAPAGRIPRAREPARTTAAVLSPRSFTLVAP